MELKNLLKINRHNHKKILWIDKDISNNNTKNFKDFIEFACQLYDYDIFKINCVEQAFKFITYKKIYDELQFKLLYIVVTDELSEEFFLEYIKRSSELNFITITTIIYHPNNNNNKNLIKNPFYEDSYLNHGKSGNSISSLVNYIESIQCPYYLSEKTYELNEIKVRNQISRDLYSGAQFTCLSSLEELAYPILICKCINCSLIEKGELENMQKILIKNYPDLKHYIKPSQEKDILIPYNILGKFYLYLYTIESPFHKDLNRDLEEGKFDKYRIYIYILYSCLNKGLFKSYNKTDLYRGGTLSKAEFNNLMEKYIEIKKSNSNKKLSFFSKRFLSFSKNEDIANIFIKLSKEIKEVVLVKFIIEKNNNNNNYCTNVDLNETKSSEFNDEEEVLFLPFSCFEVISIEDGNFLNYDIKIIRLKYLNEYENQINVKYLELLNDKQKYEKEIDTFIKNILNSKFSHELTKCLNDKLNQNLIHEYKNIFPIIKKSITEQQIKYFSQNIYYLFQLGVGISSAVGINKTIGGILFPTLILGASLGLGFLKEKIRKEEEEKFFANSNSNSYCTSLFYNYLPEKYRKNIIPSIKWINHPLCESCSIELIIDDKYDDPAFLIINVNKKIIEINEFNQNGDVLIKYKGIPENAFSAYFAIYMFNKEKITIKEFFETKYLLKNGISYIKNLITYRLIKII